MNFYMSYFKKNFSNLHIKKKQFYISAFFFLNITYSLPKCLKMEGNNKINKGENRYGYIMLLNRAYNNWKYIALEGIVFAFCIFYIYLTSLSFQIDCQLLISYEYGYMYILFIIIYKRKTPLTLTPYEQNIVARDRIHKQGKYYIPVDAVWCVLCVPIFLLFFFSSNTKLKMKLILYKINVKVLCFSTCVEMYT